MSKLQGKIGEPMADLEQEVKLRRMDVATADAQAAAMRAALEAIKGAVASLRKSVATQKRFQFEILRPALLSIFSAVDAALSSDAGVDLLKQFASMRAALEAEVARLRSDNEGFRTQSGGYLKLAGEAVEAQTRAAAMRGALENLTRDELLPPSEKRMALAALSSDAGRDYVHRSDVACREELMHSALVSVSCALSYAAEEGRISLRDDDRDALKRAETAMNESPDAKHLGVALATLYWAARYVIEEFEHPNSQQKRGLVAVLAKAHAGIRLAEQLPWTHHVASDDAEEIANQRARAEGAAEMKERCIKAIDDVNESGDQDTAPQDVIRGLK